MIVRSILEKFVSILEKFASTLSFKDFQEQTDAIDFQPPFSSNL